MRKFIFSALAFGIFSLLFLPGVFAIGASLSDSGTFAETSVSSASNLYAYEINFDYSGSYSSPTFAGFLGSGTSTGSSARSGILSVYESKLDSTQAGVSGSGLLFNMTHSGDLELRYALFVYANGNEEYVYYNNTGGSSGSTTTTSGSGSSSTNDEVIAPNTLDVEQISLTADTEELSINSIVGQENVRSFRVLFEGGEAITLEISTEGLEDYITIPSVMTFQPGQERLVAFEIAPVFNGLLTGKIIFSYNGESVLEVPVVLNVRSENFLFDTTIALSDFDRQVTAGQRLIAQVDLKEVSQGDKVDIIATYYVKDYSGNVYFEDSETFFVLGEKSYTKEIITDNLPPGKYIFGLEIVYPGAFATSSAYFEVKEPFSFINNPTAVIVLIVAIGAIAVLVVLYFSILRTPKRYRRR
ncbi:MAG: hypothetical protein AABW79_01405 [Nanoarchaeota archaeon]